MKKTLLVIVCLLLLLPVVSIGEPFTLDGYKWDEWGKSGDSGKSLKLGFAMGWVESGKLLDYGLLVFIAHIRSEEWRKGLRKLEPAFPPLQNTQNIVNSFLKEKGLYLPNVTCGQIVDVIDKVYSDPRVKTWEIDDVMPLVMGRLKEGWTEKDLDEVIAFIIKEREFYKKDVNFKNESESQKWLKEYEELRSVEPKVLKALRAYKFE